MFTRKMFIGMVVTSFLLVTVGAGYSSAMRRPTRLASVQASADVYLSQEIVVSALDNNKYSPAVAYNSNHDQYMVVWENVWPGGHHDIYAQRISSTGQLLSWFAVSVNTNKQMQPSVAYDPLRDRYLVTWIYDVWGNGTD